MDFKMFIEFPGILITIGVALLIVAIIIGIVAFKKVDENENTNLINREIEDYENEKDEIGTDIPDVPFEEHPINQNNFVNHKPHEDLEKTHVFENNFMNKEINTEEIKEAIIKEESPVVEQMPIINNLQQSAVIEEQPVYNSVNSSPTRENIINNNDDDIELL